MPQRYIDIERKYLDVMQTKETAAVVVLFVYGMILVDVCLDFHG